VLLLAAPANAAVPLTRSGPYRALCRSQGGTFLVAVDAGSLYCNKEGALFTAFTPEQLDRQRRLCTRHYGGTFGVEGFEEPDGTVGTTTFCYVA
jgi:hypothetical protein